MPLDRGHRLRPLPAPSNRRRRSCFACDREAMYVQLWRGCRLPASLSSAGEEKLVPVSILSLPRYARHHTPDWFCSSSLSYRRQGLRTTQAPGTHASPGEWNMTIPRACDQKQHGGALSLVNIITRLHMAKEAMVALSSRTLECWVLGLNALSTCVERRWFRLHRIDL